MKHFLAAAVALCALSAPWAHAEPAPPLARLANDEVISEQDLTSYLERRMDLRPIARNAWGVEEVVGEMALTRALTLEGARLGVPRREGDTPTRFDDVYGLAVHQRQMPACEKPADEAGARKFFDQHPEAFVLPVQARVQRIILPVKATLDGQAAQAWLQQQVFAVASGQRNFGQVATAAEAVYGLEAQGDLGWLTLEGDNPIMQALQSVKPGEILGPVRDGEFVYLFLMTDRREPRSLGWEEAKGFAATRAANFCRSEAQAKIRSQLFERYGVQIDREAIRQFFSRQDAASVRQ